MSENCRHRRRKRLHHRDHLLLQTSGPNPMSGVANLFDVAMVFAVALLLAMFAASDLQELLFSQDDLTIIKNADQDDMEIIMKKGVKLERYRMTPQTTGGEGQRLGICYRLPNGEVVYVPESPTSNDHPLSPDSGKPDGD